MSPTARPTIRDPGPEIWEQTGGKVDGFICAVGTGGTLAGVADRAADRNPDVMIGLADPTGAALYNYYTQGELEGRGQLDHRGHRPGPRSPPISRACRSTRLSASPTRRRCRSSSTCCEHEGLCLGGSIGINVAGAIRMARDLGPGHTIVTVLCDYGTRYQSQALQPGFLRAKGLPVPAWLERGSGMKPPLL